MGNCLNRMFWRVSWQLQHVQCLIFILCLTGLLLQTGTNGNEAKLQRRFMWKQMDMDNLVNGMANSARAMRHMLSELVPTNQKSTTSSNILEYLPSETTRVKYIIRSPTSKRPVKIIKMRPSKKVIKMTAAAPQLNHFKENKSVPTPKPIKQQQFLSNEEMHKLEKEQELIAEGRSPPKPETKILNALKEEKVQEKTTPSPKSNNEVTRGKILENNGWLPVYDARKSPAAYLHSKPSVLSPLHTNIMAEPLPKPEQLILQLSAKSKDEPPEENEDSLHLHNFYEAPRNNHGYEVTEYIAEESIPLPHTQSPRINVRAGVASSKYFSYALPQVGTLVKSKTTAIIKPGSTTSTEEPPNYPESFLRSFQERTATTAASSPASAAASARARFRANVTESNNGWTMVMPKATYKTTAERATFRSKLQHASNTSMRTKSEKWPAELPPSIPSSMSSQLVPHSLGLAVGSMPTGNMRQLAAGPPTTATKQLPLATANGRLRKTLTSTAPSPEQSGDAPKSRNIRHRGTIKFSDKTFEDI